MNKFWNMTKAENKGFLTMFGDISDVTWMGDEVTPRMFKQELDDMGDIDELDISINSGGGDVFAGQTIYNILKNHKAHKVVRIEGLAASIASVIAMAGDEIVMPENAMMMIHEAWSGAVGNKRDMRKMADTLEVIDGTIRGIYAARTGLSADSIADMMEKETWMTGADACAMGFCDTVEENKKIAASVMKNGNTVINGVEIDMNRFKNAAGLFEETAEEPPKDVIDEIENEEQTVIDDHSNGETSQPVDDAKYKALQKLLTII